MTELEKLPLNRFLLKKNPEIVLTVKKVKKNILERISNFSYLYFHLLKHLKHVKVIRCFSTGISCLYILFLKLSLWNLVILGFCFKSFLCLWVQCRKFVGSETIRLKAEFLYNKFKGLFLVGDDAFNFSKVMRLELILPVVHILQYVMPKRFWKTQIFYILYKLD